MGRPQRGAQFVPADELPGVGEQHLQDPQRLFLQSDFDASPAQLSGVRIKLERAETNGP